MLSYLKMAANNKDRLALALHEYSLDLNITNEYPVSLLLCGYIIKTKEEEEGEEEEREREKRETLVPLSSIGMFQWLLGRFHFLFDSKFLFLCLFFCLFTVSKQV